MTRLRFLGIPVAELEERSRDARGRPAPHRVSCAVEHDASTCARSSSSLLDGLATRRALPQLPPMLLNDPDAHEAATRAACGDLPPEADFVWAADSSTLTPAAIAQIFQRPRRKLEVTPLDDRQE